MASSAGSDDATIQHPDTRPVRDNRPVRDTRPFQYSFLDELDRNGKKCWTADAVRDQSHDIRIAITWRQISFFCFPLAQESTGGVFADLALYS